MGEWKPIETYDKLKKKPKWVKELVQEREKFAKRMTEIISATPSHEGEKNG